MQIQLTRDSILGPGKIEHQEGVNEALKGEASKSGLVTEIKSGVKGKIYTVADVVGKRLISLGSAIIPGLRLAH